MAGNEVCHYKHKIGYIVRMAAILHRIELMKASSFLQHVSRSSQFEFYIFLWEIYVEMCHTIANNIRFHGKLSVHYFTYAETFSIEFLLIWFATSTFINEVSIYFWTELVWIEISLPRVRIWNHFEYSHNNSRHFCFFFLSFSIIFWAHVRDSEFTDVFILSISLL